MRGFRAWHTKLNRYLKDDEFFISADGKVRNDSFGRGNYEEAFDTSDFDSGYIILEQDTGLKDKSGEEIYEGDIVNAVGIGIAQVIDSPSGEWMLYYKREPDEIKNGFACVVPKNKPSGLWKTALTSYIEIVGNIHENPELLEEKK